MHQQALMTQKQAAEFLSLSPRSLEGWRYRGGGPRYVRINSRAVRYRREDLEAFLAQRTFSHTSEESAVACR